MSDHGHHAPSGGGHDKPKASPKGGSSKSEVIIAGALTTGITFSMALVGLFSCLVGGILGGGA